MCDPVGQVLLSVTSKVDWDPPVPSLSKGFETLLGKGDPGFPG
jgi:hypothetical protein